MTRGGIYGEIQPENEENTEAGAQRNFQGLSLYFTVCPDSSHDTDIINFYILYIQYFPPWLGNIGRVIFRIALGAGPIFFRI